MSNITFFLVLEESRDLFTALLLISPSTQTCTEFVLEPTTWVLAIRDTHLHTVDWVELVLVMHQLQAYRPRLNNGREN